MVEHVDIVERRQRGRVETLWKDSVDSRKKLTSTCVEQKHKRRIDETTRALGPYHKAIRSGMTTDGKDTIGYDPKISIQKKPTEGTSRD